MIAFILFILSGKLGMYTNSNLWTMVSAVCLVVWLVQLYRSLHPKPSGPANGYTGGYSDSQDYYDSTRYVCDTNGKCYDVEDGSFTIGLDGRYRGPVTSDGYVTIERDSHGDLHIV